MTVFVSADGWGCQAGNTREAPTREGFCALAGDVVGRLLQGVGGGGDGRGADAVGGHVRGAVGRAVILRVLALREAGIWGIFLGGEKNKHLTCIHLVLSHKKVRHHKSNVLFVYTARHGSGIFHWRTAFHSLRELHFRFSRIHSSFIMIG